tara:strand:+ start:11726 stop:12973 length:1248 start_codon:yes stop_codon:yes gene_type:complete
MFDVFLIQKIKNFFFPFYKNRRIKFVFNKLQDGVPKENKTAMFVGGCVRKFLNNEKIDDIDIATSITTSQIKEKFKNSNYNIIESGIKHGTITLIEKDLKLEITTLRKDTKTDGRHAEVEYIDNWQEDSNRRDFTINAIYLDINGKIFDPQSGTTDLKNKEIKFIGDPQRRIEEDYLRIIRYLRFSLEYGSRIDDSTHEAVKLNLNGVTKISKERILTELLKILKVKNFINLNKYKIIKEIFSLIFPELRYLERLDRLNLIMKKNELDSIDLLAILLIDKSNNHEYFSHKYKTSNEIKEKISLIATNFYKNKDFLTKDLKKNIYLFGKNHLKSMNILNFCVSSKTSANKFLDTLKIIDKFNIPKFPYDGNYLKDKGLIEGLKIGQTLELLEEEWLKNNFKISSQKVQEIIDKRGD